MAVGIYYLHMVSSMILFGLYWDFSGLCYFMEAILGVLKVYLVVLGESAHE